MRGGAAWGEGGMNAPAARVKTPELLSQTRLLEELAVKGDVASAGGFAEGLARQAPPCPSLESRKADDQKDSLADE